MKNVALTVTPTNAIIIGALIEHSLRVAEGKQMFDLGKKLKSTLRLGNTTTEEIRNEIKPFINRASKELTP